MTKFIKSALTSKWLLVVQEYELVKQGKSQAPISKQLDKSAMPSRCIAKIFVNTTSAGLSPAKTLMRSG